MKSDIVSRVTEQIISDIKLELQPWQRPWTVIHPAGGIHAPVRFDLKPYNGFNVVILWLIALEYGFTAPVWMTPRRAAMLGGQVRAGERGAMITYFSPGGAKTRTGQASAFARKHAVFNVEQIAGLPERFYSRPAPQKHAIARIRRAERFIAATGAVILHGGGRAQYNGVLDEIMMPAFEAFDDAESYYLTLAHELIHWTRHPLRMSHAHLLAQDTRLYAMEELTAELGAAFLLDALNLTPRPRIAHAAYMATWLESLPDIDSALREAAEQAANAVDYLSRFQRGKRPPKAWRTRGFE